MNTLSKLQNCNSIDDIISSFSLKITSKQFAYILYVLPDNKKYKSFDIPKSDGTTRNILCPENTLKYLQKEFCKIISNCVTEIQQVNPFYLFNNHAFEKYKSIASNAYQHERQRYILNIDIENFFNSIHYGRVVGFFQKDKFFKLSENCAKIIAKLATCNGCLPQGSPLSPILASLIGNIVDYRLLNLAKKYKLKYTRYADDITFSSNRDFSHNLLVKENDVFIANKKLVTAIKSVGFKINNKKTRYTNRFHRQMVTGVVVNQFINVNRLYKKKTRAMVYNLFTKGSFKIKGKDGTEKEGNIKQLIGRLNHIISIKYRDRILNPNLSCDIRNEVDKKLKENLIKIIQFHGSSHYLHKHIGIDKVEHLPLSNRDKNEVNSFLSFIQKNDDRIFIPDDSIKLLRNVLFYKYFISSEIPSIITEGKTDVIYFKTALKELSVKKELNFIKQKSNGELNKLGLTGGTDPINKFITNAYHDNKYVDFLKLKVKPKAPVIFILDYDDGLDKLSKVINSKFSSGKRFAQIENNIYILLLDKYNKLGDGKPSYKVNPICIENLIYSNGEKIEVKGDQVKYQDSLMSKERFSQYVMNNSDKFNFDKFKEILFEIDNVINHFRS